jgi:phage repressor protein C with HTH and peptisase S24 domain
VIEKINNQEMMAFVVEAINNNQEIIFRVQGTSMEPFLKHNKTNVTLSSYKKLSKGDIILFRLKNEYKLHRIIKIKDKHIIAKGDNAYSKEYLLDSDIIGVVSCYETNGKVRDPKSFDLKIYLCLWRFIKPVILILRRLYAFIRK